VISPTQFVGVCTRGWGADSTTTAQAEVRILRLSAIIVLDRSHSGTDRKPWFKTRPKYSDDASYRIRQNLQISSERFRSMLRSIDTILTC